MVAPGAEMNQFLFGRHSWPFVLLGGLLAVACLASTWYINRLQGDLARAVRHDASRMEAADELQVQLRHLRFHTLVYAADPTDARRDLIRADEAAADAAVGAIRQDITADDEALLAAIEGDYADYKRRLGPDGLPPPAGDIPGLVHWSDAHPMRDLLQPCRVLADRQRARMDTGADQGVGPDPDRVGDVDARDVVGRSGATDAAGELTTYFYDEEGNYYGRNGDDYDQAYYVRGGSLTSIQYGTRANAETSTPPGRITLLSKPRCAAGMSRDRVAQRAGEPVQVVNPGPHAVELGSQDAFIAVAQV